MFSNASCRLYAAPLLTSIAAAICIVIPGSILADDVQSSDLNIRATLNSDEPRIVMRLDDGGSPASNYYAHQILLGEDNVSYPYAPYLHMAFDSPSGRWIWNAGSGGKMEFASQGVLTLDSGPQNYALTLDATIGSVTFTVPSSGGPTTITLQPDNWGNLLLNDSPLLNETSGDARYLSANTPLFTQAAADSRYLRTDQQRLQFGNGSAAQSNDSVALGWYAVANGKGAIALGAADGDQPANWVPLRAEGKAAVALGWGARALNDFAFAGGWRSAAYGRGSLAMGLDTWANEEASVALGSNNWSTGAYSFSMGWGNIASGAFSAAVGNGGRAGGTASLSLGIGSETVGSGTLAVGANTKAVGHFSISAGHTTQAIGDASFAMGGGSYAGGVASFAFGGNSEAMADWSVAGGIRTKSTGWNSYSFGQRTVAAGANQFVIGAFNAPIAGSSPGDYHYRSNSDALFIIGNGYETEWENPDTAARQNAFVVRWNGDTEASGKLTLGTATGPKIQLDPQAQTITINGQQVLTSGSAGTVSLNSVLGGGATSAGAGSFAFGLGTSAATPGSIAFGSYNVAPGSDDLVVVGNGADGAPRNAVTVKKNGTLGIGTTAPTAHFHVAGANPFTSTNGDLFRVDFASPTEANPGNRKNALMVGQYGGVGIGSGALGNTYWGPTWGLDVSWGGIPATLTLGADLNTTSRTNYEAKYATIATAPYVGSGPDARPTATIATAITLSDASLLSIGGGNASGTAMTEIRFVTAPSVNSFAAANPANPDAANQEKIRMVINRQGGIAAGTGTVASEHPDEGPSQFVVGRFNNQNTAGENGTNHRKGLFVVGCGSSDTNRKNAMRVLENGTILIQPAGNISMGEFNTGERP